MSRAARIEPRLFPRPETRAKWGEDGWQAGAYLGSGFGPGSAIPATCYAAENLSALTGCVELIAGTIASLPAFVYLDGPNGRAEAGPNNPVVRLIRRPCRGLSWSGLMHWAVAQMLQRGNALLWVRLDGRGAVVELVPVPWQWVLPQILPNGRLVFDVLNATPEARALNLPARLLDSDVLHLKARTDTGILGRSVLARAAGVIRDGLDVQTLAGSNWRNGAKPSGLLTRDKLLSADQRREVRERLNEFTGPENAGKTMLLEGGWSFVQLGLSAADVELLASRKLVVAEIARLFCIPVQMIDAGERAIPSLAPFIVAFAQLCLAPIVTAIEQEFAQSVMTDAGTSLTVDLSGLTRGDFATRWSAWAVAIQNRVLTVDEIREAEGYGPLPDGAFPAAPTGAGSPQDPDPGVDYPPDRPGLPSLAPKPGPRPSPLPAPGTHANAGRA